MANIDINSPGANGDALRTALSKLGAGAVGQSGASVAVTGTLTETVLGTVTIPGGVLGANGQVEIEALFSYTNSANNKTLRFKFGGTTYWSTTATTTALYQQRIRIANKNSAASQLGMPSASTIVFGASAGGATTSAVDTTQDVTVQITGQLANTGETITLESYYVRLLPKA